MRSPGIREIAVTTFPPAIDFDHMRSLYRDLSHLSDSDVFRHYETSGRNEGRIASALCTRSGFLSAVPRTGKLLEIGPLCAPAFSGERVSYFDVLDRTGLIDRARAHGLDSGSCPEKIDYVSPTGDLSIVDGMYETIFSSHCIEHQPDLIKHLTDARRIISPSGRYFLAIPDKRYCFDHFLEESTPFDIVAANLERRRVHTFKSVYNLIVMTTHNDSVAHWTGNSADPHGSTRDERIREAERIYKSLHGAYFDCHAWQFTPQSFHRCLTILLERQYIQFSIERIYETVRNANEFFCILKAV
jgi:hypothetical protein